MSQVPPRAAAFMVVRDEEELLERNIRYHLDLGFCNVVVVNHCSRDRTAEILHSLASDGRVSVLSDDDPRFDNERLANRGLQHLLHVRKDLDWVFPLDADEFLVVPNGLDRFLRTLDHNDIRYGTIGWLNALSSYHSRTDARDILSTTRFYLPSPEREWQHVGHFRKAFVKVHAKIQVVAGGHYFRRERNAAFFAGANWSPTLLDQSIARICHYEIRGTPEGFMNKCRRLARPGSPLSSFPRAGWSERVHLFRAYSARFHSDLQAVEHLWFTNDHTIWGTPIHPSSVVDAFEVAAWNERVRERIPTVNSVVV